MLTPKPKWTPIELHEKLERFRVVTDTTLDHEYECGCNGCNEWLGLSHLLSLFSESEKAGAVIEANKLENER